ncbi:hypothetical protein ACFSUK_30275 [Sphingobium scionense]
MVCRDAGRQGQPLASLKAASGFRPDFLKPIIGLERGLTDPITDLGMGQTAEILAHLFSITRAEADAYAVESHKRLARAQAEGWLEGKLYPRLPRMEPSIPGMMACGPTAVQRSSRH